MEKQEENVKNTLFDFLIKHRAAIIVGLISGWLLIHFIDPIFSFLGRVLIALSSTISSAYLDRLYSEVATSGPNIGFILLEVFAGFCLGVGVVAAILLLVLKYRRKSTVPASKGISGWATMLILLITLSPSLLMIDTYIRLKTVSTFNQRLTIISPYLSDQERRILMARFASMDGKKDFDSLMQAIEEIAHKNQIRLPNNRLYPI